jgi:hypothetical protein
MLAQKQIILKTMKRIKKKKLVGSSIILCLIAFIIPFFLRECNDSLLTVISVSFSAVGTVATLIALLIAIFLYERFGLESRFINNQTDKVLELVDLLKGKYIMCETNNGKYLLGTNRGKIKTIKEFPKFNDFDKNKLILISDEDYKKAWSKILVVKRNYWLPQKIKKKLSFLELIALTNVENAQDEKYVRLDFGIETDKTWSGTIPEMTFEEFITQLDNLVKSIEKWLKQHSDIIIDFKLEEPEKYPSDIEK